MFGEPAKNSPGKYRGLLTTAVLKQKNNIGMKLLVNVHIQQAVVVIY